MTKTLKERALDKSCNVPQMAQLIADQQEHIEELKRINLLVRNRVDQLVGLINKLQQDNE